MFSLYIKGVNKNKVMKIQFCYIMRNEIRFYYIMCNENHIFVVGSCPIPTTTQTPIIISNPLTTRLDRLYTIIPPTDILIKLIFADKKNNLKSSLTQGRKFV